MFHIFWHSFIIILLKPSSIYTVETSEDKFKSDSAQLSQTELASILESSQENKIGDKIDFAVHGRGKVANDVLGAIESFNEIRLDFKTALPQQNEANADLENLNHFERDFITHPPSAIKQKPTLQIDIKEKSEFYQSSRNGHVSSTPKEAYQEKQRADENLFQTPVSESTQVIESQLINTEEKSEFYQKSGYGLASNTPVKVYMHKERVDEKVFQPPAMQVKENQMVVPENMLLDPDQTESSFTDINEKTRLYPTGESLFLEVGRTIESKPMEQAGINRDFSEKSPLTETMKEDLTLELAGKANLKLKGHVKPGDDLKFNEDKNMNETGESNLLESGSSIESNPTKQSEVEDGLKPTFQNVLNKNSYIIEEDMKNSVGRDKNGNFYQINSFVTKVNQSRKDNSENKPFDNFSDLNSQGSPGLTLKLPQPTNIDSKNNLTNNVELLNGETLPENKVAVKENYIPSNNNNNADGLQNLMVKKIYSGHSSGKSSLTSENDRNDDVLKLYEDNHLNETGESNLFESGSRIESNPTKQAEIEDDLKPTFQNVLNQNSYIIEEDMKNSVGRDKNGHFYQINSSITKVNHSRKHNSENKPFDNFSDLNSQGASEHALKLPQPTNNHSKNNLSNNVELLNGVTLPEAKVAVTKNYIPSNNNIGLKNLMVKKIDSEHASGNSFFTSENDRNDEDGPKFNEGNHLNETSENILLEADSSVESNPTKQFGVEDGLTPTFQNVLNQNSYVIEEDMKNSVGRDKNGHFYQINSSVTKVNQSRKDNSEDKLFGRFSDLNSQGASELAFQFPERTDGTSKNNLSNNFELLNGVTLPDDKVAVKENYIPFNNNNYPDGSSENLEKMVKKIDSEHTSGNSYFPSENDNPSRGSDHTYSSPDITYQSEPDTLIQKNIEQSTVETTTTINHKSADIISRLSPNSQKEGAIYSNLENTLDSRVAQNDSTHEENQGTFEYLENIEFNLHEVLHVIKTDKNVRAFILNSVILYFPVLICDVLLWVVIVKLVRHIRRQIISNQPPELTETSVVQQDDSDDVDRPICARLFTHERSKRSVKNGDSRNDDDSKNDDDDDDDLKDSSSEFLIINSKRKDWYPPN